MSKKPVERMLEEKPLAKFSVYTAMQSRILMEVGQEIRSELDQALEEDGQVEGVHFDRAHGLFWLWVLGAYEVVRTMSAAPDCFSEQAFGRIREFKGEIAELRMPFAKQEYRGEKVPIWGEASVWGFDHESRDLEFEVKNEIFSLRSALNRFDSLITSFSQADILADHRTAYDVD